jgi:hypothetical protein
MEKFKLDQYPTPIIGKGYKWSVGALKDLHIQSHTIHQQNKLLNLQLHPIPLVLRMEKIISLLNSKMVQLLVSILIRPSCCFGWGTIHIRPNIHTCSRESLFHLNYLAQWITPSCSFNVNLTRISPTYKYVITCESSYIFMAPYCPLVQ